MKFIVVVAFVASLFVISAVASNTGNNELLQAVNAALAEYKSTNTLSSNYQQWYGVAPDTSDDCSGFSYPTTPTAGGTLANIISSGVLRIGSDVPSEPLYFFNASNPSQLIGFDVETSAYVAAKLSSQYNAAITVTRVTTPFGDLLTTLNSADTYDLASGGMFKTAVRELTNAFSCNITTGSLAGLITTSNFGTYPTISSLNVAGVTIGVLANSTQQTWLQQNVPLATLVSVVDAPTAVPQLTAGTLTAWVGTDTTIAYYLKTSAPAGITQLPRFGDKNGVAWAFRFDATPTQAPTQPPSSGAVQTSAALLLGVAAVFVALL